LLRRGGVIMTKKLKTDFVKNGDILNFDKVSHGISVSEKRRGY
jgi:hypothetical protein